MSVKPGSILERGINGATERPNLNLGQKAATCHTPNSSGPAQPFTWLPRTVGEPVLNPAITSQTQKTNTTLRCSLKAEHHPASQLMLGVAVLHASKKGARQTKETTVPSMLGDRLCPPPQDEEVPPRETQRGSTLNQRRPGGPDSPCNCDNESPRVVCDETFRGRSWISHRPLSAAERRKAGAAWPCSARVLSRPAFRIAPPFGSPRLSDAPPSCRPRLPDRPSLHHLPFLLPQPRP